MNAATMRLNGRAAATIAFFVVSSSAHAETAHSTADIVTDNAVVSLDAGGGVFQPNLAGSTFTTLDTWNGQHTYYHATGAALGFAHPMGWIINATIHAYPFSFRGIGLVSTAEFGGFTGNTTSGSSAFGPVDASNNSYWSILVGPEAQLAGSFFARAGILGGGRYSQIDDFTSFEWRVAARGQVDWILGDVRRKDSTVTFGVFGGADLFPALGWSAGASIAVAFL